jgi:hypothetical protein
LAKRTGSSSNHSQAARRLAKFHGFSPRFSPPHNDPVEEGGGQCEKLNKNRQNISGKNSFFYFKTA